MYVVSWLMLCSSSVYGPYLCTSMLCACVCVREGEKEREKPSIIMTDEAEKRIPFNGGKICLLLDWKLSGISPRSSERESVSVCVCNEGAFFY